MNTRYRNALVFALLLPLATMAVAEARPGGSSFRGGFSSQKSTAARNSAAPKQPSFGSFGARRPDAAPARSSSADRGSAASRDLDRRAAQERAMRNWDSRRDAAAGSSAGAAGGSSSARSANGATPPLPPLNPVLPGGASTAGRSASGGAAGYGGSGAAGAGGTMAGGYGQPGPAPVVVRDRGSSPWLWGIGGYLLGNSVLSHAKESPPAASPSSSTSAPAGGTPASDAPGGTAVAGPDATSASGDAATGAAAGAAAGGMAATAAARTAETAAAARELAAQGERNTVRTLTWLALLMGFTWLLYLGWRHVRAGKKHANYQFERN